MRNGEPHLHDTFDILCAQYAPAPLTRGWKKGHRIPEHHMPSPDDYVFAHSKVWCFDFVDTYNTVLKCTASAAKHKIGSQMRARWGGPLAVTLSLNTISNAILIYI